MTARTPSPRHLLRIGYAVELRMPVLTSVGVVNRWLIGTEVSFWSSRLDAFFYACGHRKLRWLQIRLSCVGLRPTVLGFNDRVRNPTLRHDVAGLGVHSGSAVRAF
jgi:hypothetical protein